MVLIVRADLSTFVSCEQIDWYARSKVTGTSKSGRRNHNGKNLNVIC